MSALRPAVAPGEFFLAGAGAAADEVVEAGGFGGGGEEEIAGVDAVLGCGGEVVGFYVEVVEGEAAGGGDVVPAVGGEDGAVHLAVEVAEVVDVGVGFGGVVEAVVGVGEALVVADHEGGAVVVVGAADGFEGGGGLPVWGEGEGFEAVRGGIAKSISKG